MHMARHLLASLSIVVLFSIMDPSVASVTFLGNNGRIVFETSKKSIGIYTVNADGSDHTVFNTGDETQLEVEPLWSPDGNKLAFAGYHPENTGQGYDIYVVNADGSQLTNLTNSPEVSDRTPFWSPDGKKIAFTSALAGTSGIDADIYVIDVNGGGKTQLTNSPRVEESNIAWAPDSERIAFQRYEYSDGGDRNIWTANIDGTKMVNLTDYDLSATGPAWSPDGTKIAFHGSRLDGSSMNGFFHGVYTMDVDGTNRMSLTDGPEWAGPPLWSPDGAKLLFSTYDGQQHDLYTMNADGSEKENITKSPDRHETRFTWSPDGTKIAFDGQIEFDTRIYVIKADGTEEIQVSQISGASSVNPSWQPRIPPPSDTDGDNLTDDTERGLGTDPNNEDTDGDGLLDPWEVSPSVPGAGFDLDNDGVAEVSRDEVFGPYGGGGGPDETLRLPTQFSAFVAEPDPLHKDLYLEIDWQDCLKGGCPELPLNLPGGLERIDPTHHAPNVNGLIDIRQMFDGAPVENPDGRSGINLHVLVDEKLEHHPICDRGASAVRNPRFGTPEQQGTDAARAKEYVFRYVWSGHSVVADDAQSHEECQMPSFLALILQGYGTPLPHYDFSPFGYANASGRDILVSLGPMWICPTKNQRYGLSLCYRGASAPPAPDSGPYGEPRYISPGIFPANVEGQTGEFSHPMSRLMGVSEAEGIRHVWGRTLAHLLGQSLGLPDTALGNDPNDPASEHGLGPDPYADWGGIDYAVPESNGTSSDQENLPDYSLQERDLDGDGILEKEDNCPGVANPDQEEAVMSVLGKACSPDADGDGLLDPPEQNAAQTQAVGEDPAYSVQSFSESTTAASATADDGFDPLPDDTDNDGLRNSEDPDADGDGKKNAADNCEFVPNPGQEDTDGDGLGDACDEDSDADDLPDGLELAVGSDPLDDASTTEFIGEDGVCSDGIDNDGDGNMDGADSGCSDPDGDTNPDLTDNCSGTANRGWSDQDGDGVGDECDETPVPQNRRPSVTTARTWSVPEGEAATLTASANDPEGDPLTFEWDLDGDGVFETPGRRVVFDASNIDGPDSREVSVRATDPSGGSSSARSTVNVFDVPLASLVAPEESTALSGTVSLVAYASAEAGIERVEFLANGDVIGADDVAPYEVEWDTTSVSDGPVTMKVRAVDTLGTSGVSAERQVNVDNTPPEVGSFTIDLAAESDTGASNSDNLTNDTTPTLTGIAEIDSVIEVREGESLLGTANTDATGKWSLSVAEPLSEGEHVLKATSTDSAGNVSPEPATLTITVDTTAPTVSTVTPAGGSKVVAAGANVEAVFSEKMSPSSLNGAAFTLVRTGTTTPVTAVVGYDATNKKAILNPSASLVAEASYTATMKGGGNGAGDLSGNPLASDRVWSFSVNSPPTIANLAPAPGKVIYDRTPTIAATVHDLQTDLAKGNITLAVDGRVVARSAWSYNSSTGRLVYTSSRAAGRHAVRVTAADAQGLAAARSWSFSIK